MSYTEQEVMQFVEEEDVKFIRLAFCDVFGKPKNVSIMESELKRAFEMGIAIDASAIVGFGDEAHSDLFLHPDPSTLAVLPWRPEHGRVVRMYCNISYPNGTPFLTDTRRILAEAVEDAGLLDRDNLEGGRGEVHEFNLRVGAGAKAEAQDQGEGEFSHSYQR